MHIILINNLVTDLMIMCHKGARKSETQYTDAIKKPK